MDRDSGGGDRGGGVDRDSGGGDRGGGVDRGKSGAGTSDAGRSDAGRSDAADEYVDEVLNLVKQIPAGRVMTYGSIADWLGRGGPRRVGTIMAQYGGGVPWHRVVNASGRLVPGHEVEALRRHQAEGTPLRGPNQDHIDLEAAFWHPDEA